MPAALKPDLTFNDPQQAGWHEGDLAQYEANLTAMDALLGDFIIALKQAGKYDDATILLTADHTWRKDPDWAKGRLTGPKTHVPLVVKAPRQDRSACVAEYFETKNLGELIESIVSPPGMGEVLITENRIR
jgi:arylsulfatase A-like enzyme